MKILAASVVVLLMSLVLQARADNIYALIKKGDIDQARDSLSNVATAALRDGNTLFYQSLVEPDAERAARLMRAALTASVSTMYREEISYRLGQYYLLTKQYDALGTLLADYNARWESGKYRAEMLRLSILLEDLKKNYDAALRLCDRYLVRYPDGEEAQWGQIDKARVMQHSGKGVGTSQTLRKLTRERKGGGIPQALYILGMESVRKKRTDDAVFYYNLLREGYPAAVGLDHLVESLGGLTSGATTSSEAEELTGTFYSVKVGVFSEKDNASRQAKAFGKYNQKVETRKRTISGKTYHVVYVGRFQNYPDAVTFKNQLEAAHNEAFQVVAR